VDEGYEIIVAVSRVQVAKCLVTKMNTLHFEGADEELA
jgi:hypothetical protein